MQAAECDAEELGGYVRGCRDPLLCTPGPLCKPMETARLESSAGGRIHTEIPSWAPQRRLVGPESIKVDSEG